MKKILIFLICFSVLLSVFFLVEYASDAISFISRCSKLKQYEQTESVIQMLDQYKKIIFVDFLHVVKNVFYIVSILVILKMSIVSYKVRYTYEEYKAKMDARKAEKKKAKIEKLKAEIEKQEKGE